MSRKFADEIAAIQKLRDKYPSRPAMTLAKEITDRKFSTGSADWESADISTFGLNRMGADRTFFSVYSVIRRYDAAKAIKAAIDHVHPGLVGQPAIA